MFEVLTRRAEAHARASAAARRERIAAAMPEGLEVEVDRERIVIGGPGLVRRFALEAAFRWRVREAVDERR